MKREGKKKDKQFFFVIHEKIRLNIIIKCETTTTQRVVRNL